MKTYLSKSEAALLQNSSPALQVVQAGEALRYALLGLNIFPGTKWYAKSSVASSGDGTSWETAFKTITEVVAAAAAGDMIVLDGEFDEGAAVTITKQLIIVGQNPSRNGYPTMVYNSSSHELFIVKANNVEIRNIGFVQTQAKEAIKIGDTAGQAYYKLYIAGCKFDLYGAGTYAIASGDTADAPDIHIQDCLFRSFATAAILSNWTRARIDNNTFIVPTAKTGIVHSPNGGSRPDTQILDNEFITPDNTNGVGITVTNTPTAGTLLVHGNQFVYFADNDHCISKRTGYTGLNYLGITAIAIT